MHDERKEYIHRLNKVYEGAGDVFIKIKVDLEGSSSSFW